MNTKNHLFLDEFEFSVLKDDSLVVIPLDHRIWSVDKSNALSLIEGLSDLLHDDKHKDTFVEDECGREHRISKLTDRMFDMDNTRMTRYTITKLLNFLEDSYDYGV